MEGIGSRSRDHVHNASGCAAIFRLGILAHNLKFLNQVQVGNDDIRWATNVGIDDSVVEVQLGAILLPVYRRVSKAGIGNPHISFHSANALILRRGNRRNTGSESQELCEVSAIQRNIANSLLRNDRAEFT